MSEVSGSICPPKHRFEGELVRLRAREPGDEPSFYRWLNDARVTEHLAPVYPISHQAERAWMAIMPDPGYRNANLSIETTAEGTLIGSARLAVAAPENRSGELSILIGETRFWDGGYGSDTMRALCRFGFEMMGLHRIWLEVLESNARAIHVYEKLGFRHETRRREAVHKFGRWQDVLVMSLLEDDAATAAA